MNRKALISIPIVAIVIVSALALSWEPPKPEFHVFDFEIEGSTESPYNCTIDFMIQNLGVGKASEIQITLELNISTVGWGLFGGKDEEYEEYLRNDDDPKFKIRFLIINLTLEYSSLESKEVRNLEVEFSLLEEASNVDNIWGCWVYGEQGYKISGGKAIISCAEGVTETLTI